MFSAWIEKHKRVVTWKCSFTWVLDERPVMEMFQDPAAPESWSCNLTHESFAPSWLNHLVHNINDRLFGEIACVISSLLEVIFQRDLTERQLM